MWAHPCWLSGGKESPLEWGRRDLTAAARSRVSPFSRSCSDEQQVGACGGPGKLRGQAKLPAGWNGAGLPVAGLPVVWGCPHLPPSSPEPPFTACRGEEPLWRRDWGFWPSYGGAQWWSIRWRVSREAGSWPCDLQGTPFWKVQDPMLAVAGRFCGSPGQGRSLGGRSYGGRAPRGEAGLALGAGSGFCAELGSELHFGRGSPRLSRSSAWALEL